MFNKEKKPKTAAPLKPLSVLDEVRATLPESAKPKNRDTLRAMAAERIVGKADGFLVDPRLIQEDPGFNLRDIDTPAVQEHINSLKEAFKAGQYVHPVLVREDGRGNVFMVDGHCRRRAALLAMEETGMDDLRLHAVRFRGNDADRIDVMLRSSDGLKLTPLEVSRGYKRLIALGFDNNQIAKRVGKTASYVEHMLVLGNADTKVQDMVAQGLVAPALVVSVIREHGDDAYQVLQKMLKRAQSVGKGKVTGSEVKPWVPPRRTVVKVLGSLKTFQAHINQDLLDSAAKYKEEGVEQMVSVPVSMLADLIESTSDVDEEILKKEKRDQKRLKKGEKKPNTPQEVQEQ